MMMKVAIDCLFLFQFTMSSRTKELQLYVFSRLKKDFFVEFPDFQSMFFCETLGLSSSLSTKERSDLSRLVLRNFLTLICLVVS